MGWRSTTKLGSVGRLEFHMGGFTCVVCGRSHAHGFHVQNAKGAAICETCALCDCLLWHVQQRTWGGKRRPWPTVNEAIALRFWGVKHKKDFFS